MDDVLQILLVLFSTLIPTGRGKSSVMQYTYARNNHAYYTQYLHVYTACLYAHLDENVAEDLVYNLDLGDVFQLTCKATSRSIEFYVVGIRWMIGNDSVHNTLFPGLNPVISESDGPRQGVYRKSLTLTAIAELNNTAVQCGASRHCKTDSNSIKTISVYSLGALLIVKDDSENSTNTVTPPYVDIKLREGGERRIGDKVHVECNSSSEHIVFCVIGAPCESEHSHLNALPNSSNPSLSDLMEYYCNESRQTMYWRTLELDVVAELDNVALQCKAGAGVHALTSEEVLLEVEDDTTFPTPTVLCPSPNNTKNGSQSLYLNSVIFLIGIWTVILTS